MADCADGWMGFEGLGVGGEAPVTPQFLRKGAEHLRNEGAAFGKSSGLDADNPDAVSRLTPPSSGLPVSADDSMTTSGAQPYDPCNNYLSPRPRFLRYKPGRLREMYLRTRREMEAAEGGSDREGTPPVAHPSPTPRREDGSEDLNPACHDEVSGHTSEEEGDMAEGESPSRCRMVWKALLVLGILISVAGYISSIHSFSASSSQNFQANEVEVLQTQDAVQGTAAKVGLDSDMCCGASELALTESNFERGYLDGLCDDAEGEELRGYDVSIADAIANAHRNGTGGQSLSPGGNLPAESQVRITGNGDFVADDSNLGQKEFWEMALSEEVDEYAARRGQLHEGDEKKLLVDEEYSMDGSELFVKASIALVDVATEVDADVGAEIGHNHEGDNRGAGDVIFEENPLGILEETETKEASDTSLVTDGTAKPPRRHATPRCEEKGDSRGDDGCGDAGGFGSYGMKLAVAVLMTFAFPTLALLRFWRPGKAKFSAADVVSASSPSSGGASEGGSETNTGASLKRDFDLLPRFRGFGDHGSYTPATTAPFEERLSDTSVGTFKDDDHHDLPTAERLKRDFDLLAKASGFGDYGSYTPAVELLKGRLTGSSVSTNKYEEINGTHPPTAELLGEFSVAERASSETGYSSLETSRRKASKSSGRRPQSPETSVSNYSLSTVDRSPSASSTTKSGPRGQPGKEMLEMKQTNRRRHASEEAASTPLRRSSRIRSRIASP